MQPPSEHVHWLFATGFLILGLVLLAEALVGEEVWRRSAWRPYVWPSVMFALGVLLWPVMALYTNSTIHVVAHGAWAEFAMIAGAANIALLRGKLQSEYWRLTMPLALAVAGTAFLVHEQNGWLYSRSAFVHHASGWTLVVASIFPLALVFRRRSMALQTAYALAFVVFALFLYTARDVAPIFGHLSPLAGEPHR